MSVHPLVGLEPTRSEQAQQLDDRVRITGGGVSHEVLLAGGAGRLLSQEEVVWVGEETIRLERSLGAGERWQPVGGHRGVRVARGRSVREMGGAEAECRVEYGTQAGAPLKVRFLLKATQPGRYRVRWSLQGLRGQVSQEGPYRLRLSEAEEFCSLDWLDVVARHGEVASCRMGAAEAELIFGPFELAAGEEVELDPSIVASGIYMHPYATKAISAHARRLVRTTGGTLYAVYTRREDVSVETTNIYISRSADEGATWTGETQLSTTFGEYSALAIDSSDRLHVVYRGADNHIWYTSSANGTTWSAPVSISSGLGSYPQDQPSLAVDVNDNLHVVWQGKSASYSCFQIWYSKGTQPFPATWSTPVRVHQGDTYFNTYDQYYPAIATGPDEYLHVAWLGGRTGKTYRQIWYARRTTGWQTTPDLVSSGDGMDSAISLLWDERPPSIAVDSSGHAHVVWHGLATGFGADNNQIWYGTGTPGAWGTPVRLSTGAGMGGVDPTIAIDDDGDLHVLFNGGTPTAQGVFHAEKVQGDWSTPTCETLSSLQGRRPNLRWSYRNQNGGPLDWLWLQGAAPGCWVGGNNNQTVTTTTWGSQSFTALESRRVGLIRITLAAASLVTAVADLYTADASGKPVSYLGSSAPVSFVNANGAAVDFDFGGATNVTMSAGSSYCIVLRLTAGASMSWVADSDGGGCPDGNYAYSTNSGQSWTAASTIDANFFLVPYFDLEYDAGKFVEKTDYQYDALDRLVVEVDGLGNPTTYGYDADSRITTQIDARGYTMTFEYDAEGRQTAIVDARGYRWTSQYDSAGQLTAQVDPLVHTTSYDYYDDGLLRSRLDARGQRTTYSYDEAHRRTLIQYQDGSRVTSLYDKAGNLTELRDRVGITTYSYDERDQVLSVLYPVPQPASIVYTGPITISYQYNAVGERTKVTDADGGVTTYTYNSDGLLWWIQNPFGFRTTWLYDADSQPTTMTHGNSATVHYSYEAGRIVGVRNRTTTLTLSNFTYTYDDAGNPTGMTESVSDDDASWNYDAAGQLTREWRTRGGSMVYDLSYSYDGAGNRLTKVDNVSEVTASYSYDQASQLSVKWNPALRVTYSYDANGNTTLENAGGTLATYSWDGENRLTTVQFAGGITTATYAGDGKRRRYEDVTSEQLRDFYWDGENILFQKNFNGTTDRAYTSRPEEYGELISEGGSSPNHWFHHYDFQGSTERLTDTSQATAVSYYYKAFGEPTVVSGSNPGRFTWLGQLGYYWQPNTSDYWVRARVYNPTNGRWLSRDPLGLQGPGGTGRSNAPLGARRRGHYASGSCGAASGARPEDAGWGPSRHGPYMPAGLLPYVYTGNRPLQATDPSGQIAPLLLAGIVLGVICLLNAGRVYLGIRRKRNDKFKHCVMGCAIARTCFPPMGYVPCEIAGAGKELIDVIRHRFFHSGVGWDQADLNATVDGCFCGYTRARCKRCCEDMGHADY